MKTTPNAGRGLDVMAPEGDHVLLNGWMAVPKSEADQSVAAAKAKGDDGVYAVPIALAIKAPVLFQTCLDVLNAIEGLKCAERSQQTALNYAVNILKQATA